MRLAVLGLTVLCSLVGPSPRAEPGSEDYLPSPADAPDREERQRRQAEIRAAMKAAREEAENVVQTEAFADDRPLPVRLTEQRCTGCHGSNVFLDQTRGRLGWEWAVRRMQWLHGARLNADERQLIIDYLLNRNPPSIQRSVGEWLVTTLPLAVILLLGMYRYRRRKRG